MLDELFIALSLAANAANPAHLPDVITQEESYGQYFFYVAADKAHGIDQFSTDKINAQTLKVRFTVDLSFHPDTRKVALADIDDARSRLSQGERYERFREDAEMEGPGSFLDMFDSSIVLLPIATGENWASWVFAAKHSARLPASLSIRYQAVEEDRTLTINAYSVSDDYTLEELMEHWQSLVDQYSDIPMQVFSGAPVE